MDAGIQKYRALIEAAHLGSFTQAADVLGYSQSGISRMIADLEREWGVKLLERSRGGVRLTSEGSEILPAVQSVVDEQGRLQARIDAMSGLETGLVRIAAPTSVTTYWLPSIVERFHEDYPNIDYDITTASYTNIERMIVEGKVDCGFVSLPTQHKFDTIFLERDEMKVIMAANHPMARKRSFPIEALAEYPFLTIEKQGDSDIKRILDENGIRVNSNVVTWDDLAVFAMAEKGLGISVQPQLLLRRNSFNIVAKSFDDPVYRELGLALRNRDRAPLATKRFIDYLGYRNAGQNI